VSVSLADGVRHPKIYAYTPDHYADTEWEGSRPGKGLVKVGDTDRDVAKRIKEQLAAVKMPTETPYTLQLAVAAVTVTGEVFRDHAVHKVLQQMGVHRRDGEWFEATSDEVRAAIDAARAGTKPTSLKPKVSFPMRPEQQAAVEQTAAYFTAHADDDNPPHFLWNAKMRFGKTFTTYQLAKKLGWTRVLVLTYKPAVEAGWREDLETHTDLAGWLFKGKDDPPADLNDTSTPVVWFASFQDVLGTDDAGQPKVKNEDLYLEDWDAVVVDEYHFGAWRDAARSLYLGDGSPSGGGDSSEKGAVETPDLDEDFAENLEEVLDLDVRNYLYLSGTPFRALTQGEFLEDQVFNWTYSDEQRAKVTWPGPGGNPYEALPKMHLLAYEMPDALREVALNNFAEFSLTEFFRTEKRPDGTVRFLHEVEVQKWLDLLRGQDITGLWPRISKHRPALPYEDTNLLKALQHTIWYLPSVGACFAMKELLGAQHNTFYRDYTVIVAAGSKAGMGEKALPPVRAAIGSVPQDTKTITLSCGKLMTGVTVPAWTGILMLRELKSPESYFQGAFRVQSPWASKIVDSIEGGETELIHKAHCYVLDFSPNRALRQIVDYATRLRADTAAERDDEKAVEEFMEFLPVLSFDGYSMSQLHASDVLDHLTSGISSSMLARRWNSPELLTLDLKAMEALLSNPKLLASLEQIEMFRNITDDVTALISANKELRSKALAKEKLTANEKKVQDDAAKKRDNLRKRLQRFITRIPAFMYLTDDREKTIKDIITQLEPDLFQKVTGLTLTDFEQLVRAGVFNDSKMNDAVWKFRSFEEPSLRYSSEPVATATQGGWSLRRDERFARLVNAEIIGPGDTLTAASDLAAMVTDDYGVSFGGIRHESPDAAASAATGGRVTDGWSFWRAETDYGTGTLGELAELASAGSSGSRH
jgi:T5orf172 domain